MTNFDLNQIEWGEFYIGGLDGLFEISRGNAKNVTTRTKEGEVALISSKGIYNGFNFFTIPEPNEIIYENVITINNNGSVGYAYYHPYKFIATSDVTILRLKHQASMKSKLFLITILNKLQEKYSYGYKMSDERLNRQILKLPIDCIGNINWSFMESYIEMELVKKKADYHRFIKGEFEKLEYCDLPDLKNKKWIDFPITYIFPEIKRGKRLIKKNQKPGNIPYVSSTSQNNGIANFVSNKEGVRYFNNCLTIANSGSVGSSFYHPYKFVASDHVTYLKNNKFDKYIYLFIATISKRFSEKYNFNREINDNRIQREKLFLPANEYNEPDYEFMRKFIMNIMFDKYHLLLKYLE